MVAMSGGVDSSVAAARLVAAGEHVVGVTLRLWGGESDSGCCSVADVEDARRVADQLGIEHHVFNFGPDFERAVVAPYVADHAAGRTPNPCIECNRHIKFDRLLDRAEALGFGALATGHHARVVAGPSGPRLARGADPSKDQSYVLYVIRPEALGRVRFPVGDLTKAEVRAEAERLGLRTAAKPDSQDVCFITSTQGRDGFLHRRNPPRPAVVVDTGGAAVGRVDDVQLVTVGQRRGLGLAGGAGRRYVTAVDRDAGVVTVGGPEALLDTTVDLEHTVWAADPGPQPVDVQTSAHGRPVRARIENGRRVVFERPTRRVAPGQSVVAYRDDVVVGGGVASAGSR